MNKTLRAFRCPFQNSIRRQVMALLGAVLLFLLILVSGLVTLFLFKTEQNAWRAREHEALSSAVSAVEAFNQRAVDQLILCGAVEKTDLGGDTAMRQLLSLNPAFLEVIYLDDQGALLASANRDKPLLENLFTTSQAAWFRKALNGEVYVGDAQISAQGVPYLTMAVPTLPGNVMAARIELAVFQNEIEQLRFGNDGYVYVVTSTGEIVAHHNEQLPLLRTSLKGRPEYVGIRRAYPQGWTGEYRNLEGERVMGSSMAIEGTDWVVVAEIPSHEVYAATITSIFVVSGSILLLVFSLTVVSKYYLNRVLFHPVQALEQAVEHIRAGDLSVQISYTGQDEIGRVLAAFDDMARQLDEREKQVLARTESLAVESRLRQQSLDDLEKLNRELDMRVHERTMALSQEINEREGVEAQLRQTLSQVMLLNRVIQASHSKFEANEILELLCLEIGEALQVEYVVFGATADGSAKLKIAAEYAREHSANWHGLEFNLEEDPLAISLIQKKDALLIQDIHEVSLPSEMIDWVAEMGGSALLAAPMTLRGKVMGVLAIVSRCPHHLNQNNLVMIENINTAAAQVIENAQLFDSLQHELLERKRAEEQLVYQNSHDSLTGLFNRRYFEDEMARLLPDRRDPISIVVGDLDYLKRVNDQQGHAAGDLYLQYTADALCASFRDGDMIARVGGDEFAVILRDIHEEAVEQLIERIRRHMGESLKMQSLCGAEWTRLSVGYARWQEGETLADTYRRADQKMYEDKLEHRGMDDQM
jgi:diguanylate cyclase (GGDEF)-like protein